MTQSPNRRFDQSIQRDRSLPTVAVIAGVLAICGVSVVALADAQMLVAHVNRASDPGLAPDARALLDLQIAIEIIKVLMDVYLLAIIALVLAHGVRGRLTGNQVPSRSHGMEYAGYLLLTRNVNSFSYRLIGLLLARLALGYLQRVLRLEVDRSLDLFFYAAVLFLVGGALYLGHRIQAQRSSPSPMEMRRRGISQTDKR